MATLTKPQRGFTLIELTVTLAVVAILLGIGIPAVSGVMDRQNLKNAGETLASDLRLARSEAIAMGTAVAVSAEFSAGEEWSYVISDSTGNTIVERSRDDFGGLVDMAVSATDFSDADGDGLRDIQFSATRSMSQVGSGAISFTSGNLTVEISRNLMGRVVICSNSAGLGYPSCSAS